MFLNKQYLFSFGFCFLMLSTTDACECGNYRTSPTCCIQIGRQDLHEVQKYKISNAIAQFKAKVSAKSNAKTKNWARFNAKDRNAKDRNAKDRNAKDRNAKDKNAKDRNFVPNDYQTQNVTFCDIYKATKLVHIFWSVSTPFIMHRSYKSGLWFELFKTRINNFLMGQMSVKFLVWYLTVFSNYYSHVKSSYPLSHYSALLLVFEYLIKNKK